MRKLRPNSGRSSGAADQLQTSFQHFLVRRLRPIGAETPACAETPAHRKLRANSGRSSGAADQLKTSYQHILVRRLRTASPETPHWCGNSGHTPEGLLELPTIVKTGPDRRLRCVYIGDSAQHKSCRRINTKTNIS